MDECKHSELVFESVPSKSKSAFVRASYAERIEAVHWRQNTSRGGKQAKLKSVPLGFAAETCTPTASSFPGPLALPGDDLFDDPQCPPQTMQEWVDEENRNPVTPKRRTVYVLSPPHVPEKMQYMNDIAGPRTQSTGDSSEWRQARPETNDIVDYLRAFYYPLPVKALDSPHLQWVEWDEQGRKGRKPASKGFVGLDIGNEAVRIRWRQSPDGFFAGQLNLNDLIDATLAVLPKDAYALIMLLDHDIYEDDDDDFCCGRAYGQSRVAVISMARYNPILDDAQQVERAHAWPASHCKAYTDQMRGASKRPKKREAPGHEDTDAPRTAVSLAVSAASSLPRQDHSALWLGRVCKTASHEVGHCFALDHCVYYACIMQSTRGMSEDARQPPYLCPVDLAKLLFATGAQEQQRDEALLRFCARLEARDSMFAGFAAWLRCRLSGTNAG